MTLLGFSWPWNFVVFVALLFFFNAALIVFCDWRARRRKTR